MISVDVCEKDAVVVVFVVIEASSTVVEARALFGRTGTVPRVVASKSLFRADAMLNSTSVSMSTRRSDENTSGLKSRRVVN